SWVGRAMGWSCGRWCAAYVLLCGSRWSPCYSVAMSPTKRRYLSDVSGESQQKKAWCIYCSTSTTTSMRILIASFACLGNDRIYVEKSGAPGRNNQTQSVSGAGRTGAHARGSHGFHPDEQCARRHP